MPKSSVSDVTQCDIRNSVPHLFGLFNAVRLTFACLRKTHKKQGFTKENDAPICAPHFWGFARFRKPQQNQRVAEPPPGSATV